MKVGYIDYVNCYPFYHTIFCHNSCSENEIIAGHPSMLNEMMRKGELDVSPISSAAYCDMQNSLYLFPDFSLSSEGYVRSVILMSHLPIEELSGKVVGLTSASETSRVLLKILLQKYYKINCTYVDVDAGKGMGECDALLLIGNDALRIPHKPVEYIYDIGDLWLRKTGHPVVFAVFALQKDIIPEKTPQVAQLVQCFNDSISMLHEKESVIVESAADRYKDIDFDICEYYKLLKYNFTDKMKQALIFYYKEAAQLGLLKSVDRLQFIPEEVI